MFKNLQDKVIKFSLFDDNGRWRGVGTGKVMIVDQGDKIVVSVRDHPLYQPQELLQVFPWKKEGRYQADVILKVYP